MRGETIAGGALGLLAAVLVIAGLATVGGPGQGRLERRDETRLSDLQRLASYVRCVADTQQQTLPDALRPVETCTAQVRFDDPYTGMAYRYEKVTGTAFRLCAGFEDADSLNDGRWGEVEPATGCIQHTYTPD